MKLSKNFSLIEFTKSQTAIRKGISNEPTTEHTVAIGVLCNCLLQKIRDEYNRPVRINSGYRSEDLNKAIGGSVTSQHSKGEAADIEIDGVSNFDLASWIASNLEFDQLILEFPGPNPDDGWVHCSYALGKSQRGEVLTAVREKDKVVYKKGLLR